MEERAIDGEREGGGGLDEKERRRVEEGEVNNNYEEGSRLLFASGTWTVKIYLDISNIIKYY
jgi:hypothetical protein